MDAAAILMGNFSNLNSLPMMEEFSITEVFKRIRAHHENQTDQITF